MLTGTRTLRVRRRVLQTPVIRYVNEQTRQTVTLVLSAHLGETRYYKQLQALIGYLENAGAAVQYEAIDEASEELWAAATADELAARDAIRTRVERVMAMQPYLGWDTQYDALTYSPTWHNVDLCDLELIRMIGVENILGNTRDTDKALAKLGGQEAKIFAITTTLLLRVMAHDRFGFVDRWANRGERDRHSDQVIVEQRSEVAADGIPETGDAVLLWGAGHLATLEAALARRGLRRKGRAMWMDAGTLPPLWTNLRELYATQREIAQARATVPAEDQQPVTADCCRWHRVTRAGHLIVLRVLYTVVCLAYLAIPVDFLLRFSQWLLKAKTQLQDASVDAAETKTAGS